MARKEYTLEELLEMDDLQEQKRIDTQYKPFIQAILSGSIVHVPYNKDILRNIEDLYNYDPSELQIDDKQ